LDGVSRAYEDRRGTVVEALAGVSLHAPRGSVLAVVGPSGCGKTTLLELICGLQQPDAGTVECDQAVLMPQRDLLLPWLSAVDNAALALRIAGDSRARARTRGAALFEELGLGGFEQARPQELSGGMRQRVAFLRTLLSGKPLLCLDEPLSALDAITRQEMQEWLTGALLREPRTVMLVTHDVEEAIVLADRVAVLSPRCFARAGLRRSPARNRMIRRVLHFLPAALLALALLAAWEAYVDLGSVSSIVLPAPHEVAAEAWSNAGLLAANLELTAQEVGLGVLLALILGFVLGVLIHLSPLLRRAVYHLAVGSQAVPVALIGVLLVFWWGFGVLPKLFVIVLICFFPVAVTTVDGLASVDPDQLKLLRTLGASRWQALRFGELPAAIPAALSGARIALAVGVIGAYIAETSTATSGPYAGLGHQINADINSLQTSRAYAAAVVLFVFAIACFYTLALAERVLAPWAQKPRGEFP
jgi:ABC-type nitrate/sulfonate/bicarbonate transport system ATPase subunit/ABC-type proline/glycine betaine transport system permease subunit